MRSAQDCLRGCGSTVALCNVEQLDPLGFTETVIHVVRPAPNWPCRAGVHTLSGVGNRTVMDSRRAVFDHRETRVELAARFGRRDR